MEQLPIYPLAKDDPVPIPNSLFTISIPENRIHLFNTLLRPSEVDGEMVGSFILGFMQGDSDIDNLTFEELALGIHSYGVLCEEISVTQNDCNELLVELYVVARVKVALRPIDSSYFISTLDFVNEAIEPPEEEVASNLSRMIDLLVQNQQRFNLSLSWVQRLADETDLVVEADILANELFTSNEDRLYYVQCKDNQDRFSRLISSMIHILSHPKTRAVPHVERISSQQHEVTLESRLASLDLPEEVQEKVDYELKRMNNLPKSSLERSLAEDYLDWIMSIPWGVESSKKIKLESFIDLLNETHYGLDDVKSHLLEYVTINQISDNLKGTVLCFSGPPGTGKTSIAKQIALASNRKLIPIALGGVSDESELRGFRRAYVSSRPSRIVSALKTAKTMTPLFLFDEVDKLSTSLRGNPAAALLEILDPEQNNHFIDRYLEVPIDLSKAVFICTANYEEQIPPAVRDRMEFVRFREYTYEERQEILRKYTLPKALNEYSLEDSPISWDEEVLDLLAETVQVRQIEKQVKKLLRKAAVDLHVYKKDQVQINRDYANFEPKQSAKPIGFK